MAGSMAAGGAVVSAPQARTAVVVSSDLSFRERVSAALAGLRWQVREAAGGAEALAYLDAEAPEALVLDTWLPDLEIGEFVREFEAQYPAVDLVTMDGEGGQTRSPRRNELLYALRRGQEDGAKEGSNARLAPGGLRSPAAHRLPAHGSFLAAEEPVSAPVPPAAGERLPELTGSHPAMLEVSRRVRLVAAKDATVLIQGETGTGKELVARAVHRLSLRSARPFVALNCAAIPEALLEAELFGHTRGAFTGAVQGRVGRIEAAHGGTLFLDEIGEMPLALQSKLLRFLENGEVQRIGENDPVRVNVRVVAATHQPLAGLARTGAFRADLYYRLAVFLIRTPSLREHGEDLPALAERALARLCRESPAKSFAPAASEKLARHGWPGNVRELEHVVERAYILAGGRAEIAACDIEFGDDALEG